MKMKTSLKAIAATLAVTFGTGAWAAVSADEAAKLGKSLTAVGAEVAANKDGTIPAYNGGMTTPPADYKQGSGMRPDPYASDKPRLVITGKSAAQYDSMLTAGTRALFKRYPEFRVDVYPTHRPVTYPAFILANTKANATGATPAEGGLAMVNALPGFPFPIPKSGYEAMWNHLMRYQGRADVLKYDSWNVDSHGTASLATTGTAYFEYPLFDPSRKTPATDADPYWRVKLIYTAPARRAGEALMLFDSVNSYKQPRKAYQYLPGQRRVKLAPDVSYDTPNADSAGASTYDDAFVFNGGMDRYEFKLVGKKEIIVPYNTYKLTYHPNAADITTPKYLNPDLVRWELHRVWEVEATLKPGKRHIYSKRTFYLDEDSWLALASDQYDGRGELYRSSFAHMTFSYDVLAPNGDNFVAYDFASGSYSIVGIAGPYGGYKYSDPFSGSQWSPESLASGGIR